MARPEITLKLATTLDGRIATHSGESRWITGEAARRCVHELRAGHDAVVVGIETALKDDPELTVRLPGFEGFQPSRIIFDTHARLPLHSKLAQTARVIPTYVVCVEPLGGELKSLGVKEMRVQSHHQRVDLIEALARLYDEGLGRIFIEGGAVLATTCLKAGVVDRLEWFRSPTILGGDGRAAFGFMDFSQLDQMVRFNRLGVQAVGDDLWESYELMDEV